MSRRQLLTLKQLASVPELQTVNFRRAANDTTVVASDPTTYAGYSGTTHQVFNVTDWNTAVTAAAPGDVIDIRAEITTPLRYQGNQSGSGGSGANGTLLAPIVITSSNGSYINPNNQSNGKGALEIYDCLGVWAVGVKAKNSQFGIYLRSVDGLSAADIASQTDVQNGDLAGWVRVAHCIVEDTGHAAVALAGWGSHLASFPGTDYTTEEYWGSANHVVVENCTIERPGRTASQFGECVYLGNGGGSGTFWVSNAKQILVRYNNLGFCTADYVDTKPGCYDCFIVDNLMYGGFFNAGSMMQTLYVENAAQTRPGWYDIDPNIHIEGNIVYNSGTGTGTSNYGVQASLAGVTVANNLWFGVNTGQPLMRLRGILTLAELDSTLGGEKFNFVNNLCWSLKGFENVGYDAVFTQYPTSLVVEQNNLGYTGATGVQNTTEDTAFWGTVPAVGITSSQADAGFGVGSAFDWEIGNAVTGVAITPTLFHNEDISQRSFSSPPAVGCFQESTATPPAGSSFPDVESVTTGSQAAATSGNFTMPATVNDNDVLVLVATWGGADGQPTLGSTLGTWDQVVAKNIAGDFQNHYVWILRADGTEGGQTESWSASVSKNCSYQIWRLSGVFTTGTSGTAWDAQSGSSFGANPNPPSVTATWGTAKNLFIATQGSGSTGAAVTTWPTDYTSNQTENTSLGMMTAAASRKLESSANDPTAFTIDDDENTGYSTIVFRPAAA